MRVLVVEDDQTLGSSICALLSSQQAKMVPTIVGNGIHADAMLTQARRVQQPYDAVVLDLTLPGMDGMDVLKALRAANDSTPVLVLTARSSLADRVDGLEQGADDYLAKPYEDRELVARLRAIARRRVDAPADSDGRVGNLRCDFARGVFSVDGAVMKLPPRASVILEALVRRPGQPVTKDFLTSLDDEGATPHSVDTQMSRLRRRLQEAGATVTITTLHHVGYVLKANEHAGG